MRMLLVPLHEHYSIQSDVPRYFTCAQTKKWMPRIKAHRLMHAPDPRFIQTKQLGASIYSQSKAD